MFNDELLEPEKSFESIARRHSDNTQSYFDSLLGKSGVDVAENEKTMKLYNNQNTVISGLYKELNKYNVYRAILIILAVIGIGLTVFGFMTDLSYGVILGVVGIVLALISFLILFLKTSKDISGIKKSIGNQQGVLDKIVNKGYSEMQGLNDMFSEYDALKLIEQTIPGLHFNKYYSREDELEFASQYDYDDMLDDDCSIVDTLSGKLNGNPFVYIRYKEQNWIQKTYTGHKTISWTETYEDSEGETHTRTRSETLSATVVKPAPEYRMGTMLGYGCQAGSNLSFSRSPKHYEDMSERKLDKVIKRGEKKLEDMARDVTEDGGTFQEMANTEFDVMFGALDRNNEVQFRTLFTPLAQNNMVDLLTSKIGYGDDFYFMKKKRFNIIMSEHAQDFGVNIGPNFYKSYSLKDSENRFNTTNATFFKSLYFDFAPLMAIPAYMEEPSIAMEKPEAYDTNYTSFEYETMANHIGEDKFTSEYANTDNILRANFVRKDGDNDYVNINAKSFSTTDMVDYVSKYGGDGRYHDVPVEWVQYDPVNKISQIVVEKVKEATDTNNSNNNAIAVLHGLFAKLLK